LKASHIGTHRLHEHVVTTLARCDWIRNVHLLLTGATGLGKTRTACAFILHACRRRCSALHARTARLSEALRIGARGDGSFSRRLARLACRVRHFFMQIPTFAAIESALWRDRRGSSVSADGWHRRVRCSVRRCSLAVSGHGSGAAKPARNGTTITSTLVERPIYRNHSRGGRMREISFYSRTPDFRHRKTERRLIARRQTLGAFVSSNRRGRHGRSRS
jgi:hypothetical protein